MHLAFFFIRKKIKARDDENLQTFGVQQTKTIFATGILKLQRTPQEYKQDIKRQRENT